MRYSLTYRDLEEIMAERNLSVDHVTIWRWVQRYAPVLNQRIRRELEALTQTGILLIRWEDSEVVEA